MSANYEFKEPAMASQPILHRFQVSKRAGRKLSAEAVSAEVK